MVYHNFYRFKLTHGTSYQSEKKNMFIKYIFINWTKHIWLLYAITHSHLEPVIQECEVKLALGSIATNKATESDGIPVELFQILKDDAVKVLHSICQNLENSAVATGLETISFHSNLKERQYQRKLNYCPIVLISHTNRVMLKILQTRLKQYVDCELPDVQKKKKKERK